MTTTVTVTAHCNDETEVVFGIMAGHLTDHMTETVFLKDGESAENVVYEDRAAVVIEIPKRP